MLYSPWFHCHPTQTHFRGIKRNAFGAIKWHLCATNFNQMNIGICLLIKISIILWGFQSSHLRSCEVFCHCLFVPQPHICHLILQQLFILQVFAWADAEAKACKMKNASLQMSPSPCKHPPSRRLSRILLGQTYKCNFDYQWSISLFNCTVYSW